jgi:hypothetical protein
MFRDPGGNSALRTGKREFPCPTCGQPNKLTLKDVQLGYQCDECAAIQEGTANYEDRYGKSKENIKEAQYPSKDFYNWHNMKNIKTNNYLLKEGQHLDDNYFEDVGVDNSFPLNGPKEPIDNIPFDGDEEQIEDRDMMEDNISNEPQDEDIVIGQDDRSAYFAGKKIITVKDPEELRPAIKAWMDKEQWFPDVWVISDHGNSLNVTEDVMKSEQKQEVPGETPEWLADQKHTGFASMKTKFNILKEAQFSPAEADHQLGSDIMVMDGDQAEEQVEIEKPEKVEEKPIQYAVEYHKGTSWVTLNNGKLFEDAAKAGTYMERQINRMTKMDPQIRREDLLSKLKMVPRK